MLCIFFRIQTGNLYVFLFQVPVPEGAIGGDAGECSFYKEKMWEIAKLLLQFGGPDCVAVCRRVCEEVATATGAEVGEKHNEYNSLFFASKDYLEKQEQTLFKDLRRV